MTAIKWDDSYVVGIGVIDEQHKHFVGLLNTLYESLESKHTEKIPDIIQDLTDYAEHHFKTEEDYFDKFHYPDAEIHKLAHNELRAKVGEFAERHDNPKKLGSDLLFFLEKWLLVHFRGADTKFAKFLKQNGVK
ncbi:MAG: bacteriohemerythrin [Candidatus Saccharibacteria bacterium]|nr:bacteriohemerythrin [Candidatus Saccharibacteria bacterium]